MATAVSDMIGQAAARILERCRGSEGHAGLPQGLRPKNLPEAYGIQQMVSREQGAIGGWQICAAEPEAGLASAPLPLAAVRPQPARIRMAGNQRMRLRPALAFRVGRSLPEYEAPFGEWELAAAIESTHPAVLVFGSSVDGGAGNDPLTAIAESCGTAGLIYGQARPGLPDPRVTELAITHCFGDRRERAFRTSPVGNFLAPLTWLANFGASWSGGLMVGQMVALALIADEFPIAAGGLDKYVIGDFGKIHIRAERAEP